MSRIVRVVRALRRAPRRFVTDRPDFRVHHTPVRVRVAFHGFWAGFSLKVFRAAHPYLKLKYELIECRRHPDVHFVSVFSPAGAIRNPAEVPLPGDG